MSAVGLLSGTAARLAQLWLLHGWHMKLLPSRRKFCVHRSTMHQFTVTSFKAMHTLGLDLSIELGQEIGPKNLSFQISHTSHGVCMYPLKQIYILLWLQKKVL